MLKYFLITATLLYTSIAFSDNLQGWVVGVTDGDTIRVLDASNTQHKIRLAGIDAPEKSQPFGQVSKRSLSDLVYDTEVKIEWTKRDKYGRIVGKVLVNDLDVNLEQVKQGLAWHYKKYQNEQSVEDVEAYSTAEQNAMDNRLGLWRDKQPIAPWEWRKASRNQ
jgi:endonuclease YncB( thermonuclease family)